jgi:hypothetical protein
MLCKNCGNTEYWYEYDKITCAVCGDDPVIEHQNQECQQEQDDLRHALRIISRMKKTPGKDLSGQMRYVAYQALTSSP